MTRMPAPASQVDQFHHVQSAIHEIIGLGRVHVLGSAPFGSGPDDEYLAFGMMWWRYMNSGGYQSGACDYLDPVMKRNVESAAVESWSLGVCLHGLNRVLLHLSQLQDDEFDRTVEGMLRARVQGVLSVTDPGALAVGIRSSPWPSTGPVPRRVKTLSVGEVARRRIASRVFSLVPGVRGVPLDEVDHGFVLRLCMVQNAIDGLRAGAPAYTGEWGPPESYSPIDLGPVWATCYHSALAHAVGGRAAVERLEEIRVGLDAEKCLAGVAETYDRLVAMDPAERPRAFESIDCSDYFFDPPVTTGVRSVGA